MNLFQLAYTLPNGFHDAGLQRFTMDYVRRTLDLEMDVWIGDMDDPSRREAYRRARVTVTHVAYSAELEWIGPEVVDETGAGD